MAWKWRLVLVYSGFVLIPCSALGRDMNQKKKAI